MAFIISILAAVGITYFNYREYIKASRKLKKVKFDIMAPLTESEKIDELKDTINEFKLATEIRFTAIETKLKFYFGSTTFVTIVGLTVLIIKQFSK